MGKFSKNLSKAADDAERLSRALGDLESVGGGGGGGAGGEGNTIATPQSPSGGRSVQSPTVVNFFTTVESTGGGGGGGNREINVSGEELRKMMRAIGSLRKNYNFDAGLFLRSGSGG